MRDRPTIEAPAEPSERVTRAELTNVLLRSPFAGIYKFQLPSFAAGECTLGVPFQPALERPGGLVAGCIFMTAADVAMWLAIMTKLGTNEMAVTAAMNTAFLRSAREETFHCTARVLNLGARLIYGVAECSNLNGKMLAHHTLTYTRVSSTSWESNDSGARVFTLRQRFKPKTGAQTD